jgi:putative spermidine/putrescine transport system ATP-binding protein
LLLDEPLTALDALLRDRLRVEIDNLLRSLGITSIYVTHDQSEAMALGDRIVVMSHGKVAQIGSPREIYYHPATDFVADFIGTVNRLPASAIRNAKVPKGPEVLFRPEDMDIVAAENAHFTGTIMSVLFLGDRTRLVLDGGGAEPVIIESPLRTSFEVGMEVPVRIRPEGFMALETNTTEN